LWFTDTQTKFKIDLIRGSSMVWFAENLTGVPDANTNPQGRGEIQ